MEKTEPVDRCYSDLHRYSEMFSSCNKLQLHEVDKVKISLLVPSNLWLMFLFVDAACFRCFFSSDFLGLFLLTQNYFALFWPIFFCTSLNRRACEGFYFETHWKCWKYSGGCWYDVTVTENRVFLAKSHTRLAEKSWWASWVKVLCYCRHMSNVVAHVLCGCSNHFEWTPKK